MTMTSTLDYYQDTPSMPADAAAAIVCGKAASTDTTPNPFKDMLAELDAMCRQSRELASQLTRQMADQKRAEQLVVTSIQFSRPA